MQADLTGLDDAIEIAGKTEGLTGFSDAADAASSGASGDSNAILKGLPDAKFEKRALFPLVNPSTVEATFEAGVDETLDIILGGALDPGRFAPITCSAYDQSLHDGLLVEEDGTEANGGRTAVLRVETYDVMVTSLPVHTMGRRVFKSRGLNPKDYDFVIV